MTARIYSLMFHYWRDDMPVEVRGMVIADWRAVLGDLPQAAIERAILERLSEDNDRKPKAGEIRARAKGFIEKPAPQPEAVEQPFGKVVAEDELARRRHARFQAEMRDIFPRLREMTKSEADPC